MPLPQNPQKISSRLGRILFYGAGLLLVIYLLLMLGTTYIAQRNLHAARLNELILSMEKRAAALSYFQVERMADLTNLAQDQSISVYFSNRALGMSLEYGLRASLHYMQNRFQQLVASKRFADEPVYLRLMFVDNEDTHLVDVGKSNGIHEHWDYHEFEQISRPTHTIVQDNDHFHMLLIQPYHYKNLRQGTIIAEINHAVVFQQLVQQQREGDDPNTFLLTRIDQSPESLADNASNRLDTGDTEWIYPALPTQDLTAMVKVSVPGTPYTLAAIPTLGTSGDFLQSPWLLVSLAAIAVFVLLTMIIGYRTQSANLMLQAKWSEEQRQRRRLELAIKKSREYEDKLTYQTNYDQLTELPNRHLAMDRVSQALARAKRLNQYVVAMFIDLDRFKNVNDTLGHNAGDLLIKKAAQRLQQSIRLTDTAARLGGDEFMIILPDIQDFNTAETVCEKIMDNFSYPFTVHGQDFNVTASIGVAIGPNNGTDAKTLMKSADLALHRAKEAGRASYRFFTQEMNRHAEQRQTIENQLLHAVERDELSLHFQPMIKLGDSKTIGVEALIRWFNPSLGQVSPANFIPLAEESGLIVEIGDWVIKRAMETISGLGQEAEHLRIAINVSCRQLLQPTHFLDLLESTLSHNHLSARQIEIEITERLLLEDRPDTVELLYDLKAMGFRLVVDDFGTGYSSLSYLKKFPLDGLKVDQSFIRDMLVDSNDAKLTKAIIAIAHELGMEAVGEGVETSGQADFLRNSGCDIAQGYLFGRPMDASNLYEFLKQEAGADLARIPAN